MGVGPKILEGPWTDYIENTLAHVNLKRGPNLCSFYFQHPLGFSLTTSEVEYFPNINFLKILHLHV